MKIEVGPANQMKLSGFAEKHELTMKLIERTRTDLHHSFPWPDNRWCAYFENAEVKDGRMLIGLHGNGATKRDAMKDYARQISGKLLVINAFSTEGRREVYVPELL